MSIQYSSLTIQGHISQAKTVPVSDGLTVTKISLAVNTYYRGQELTNWYTCNFWNEVSLDLLRRCNHDLDSLKGALITLTGKFLTRPYPKKDGGQGIELLLENPVILNLSLKKAEAEETANNQSANLQPVPTETGVYPTTDLDYIPFG